MNTRIFASLAAVAMLAPVAGHAAEDAVTSAAAIVQVNPSTASKAPAQAQKGAMIYAEGKRIGQVFRVRDNGDAQVVINGQSHVVPADTLIEENGKLVTTLSRAEVVSSR